MYLALAPRLNSGSKKTLIFCVFDKKWQMAGFLDRLQI